MKISIVFILQQIILLLTINYTSQTMTRQQSNYAFDDVRKLISCASLLSATHLHFKVKVMYKAYHEGTWGSGGIAPLILNLKAS
jgi:hypothetical protein